MSSPTHHIAAQPSASWKLNAISVPFDSVHTMSVSTIYVSYSLNLARLGVHLAAFDKCHLLRSSSLRAYESACLQTQRKPLTHAENWVRLRLGS